jgi:hypothetical protein
MITAKKSVLISVQKLDFDGFVIKSELYWILDFCCDNLG